MGIGRYHGQTKTLMELRKTPTVELLDQDEHLLVSLSQGTSAYYIGTPVNFHMKGEALLWAYVIPVFSLLQKKQYSEQEHMHKSRIEFRQM